MIKTSECHSFLAHFLTTLPLTKMVGVDRGTVVVKSFYILIKRMNVIESFDFW